MKRIKRIYSHTDTHINKKIVFDQDEYLVYAFSAVLVQMRVFRTAP